MDTDEPLPPYSSSYGNDEKEFRDEKKEGLKARLTRSVTQRIGPVASASARSASRLWEHQAWQFTKKHIITKRQGYAFILFLSLGLLPFVLYGHFESVGDFFYYNVFAAKVIACGDDFGEPQNSTVMGVEAMFVLDLTFGSFTFAQVKTIDVAWDILVGRGAQFIAWWVSYRVFSDALLRLIERHPAPYEAFMRLGLDGASLGTGWTLLAELFRKWSKRTWALFFFMLLSTIYVLSIPAVVSAMTGYNSRTIAWVNVGSDDNIVPASFFEPQYIVFGTLNTTFDKPSCAADEQIMNHLPGSVFYRECHCQLPNGTVTRYWDLTHTSLYLSISMSECLFNYTGNTQTYKDYNGVGWCNQSYPITIDNKTYPYWDLNSTFGYCWQGTGYDQSITGTARCLPDTAHPSYTWGFSTMLLGVFFILQFAWSIAMYVIWQDAQFNSQLVQSGFRITQMRAAFVLLKAAKMATGLEDEELIRKDGRELNRGLFGSRTRRGAEIDRDIFWEPGSEVRKRAVREEDV